MEIRSEFVNANRNKSGLANLAMQLLFVIASTKKPRF